MLVIIFTRSNFLLIIFVKDNIHQDTQNTIVIEALFETIVFLFNIEMIECHSSQGQSMLQPIFLMSTQSLKLRKDYSALKIMLGKLISLKKRPFYTYPVTYTSYPVTIVIELVIWQFGSKCITIIAPKLWINCYTMDQGQASPCNGYMCDCVLRLW